MRRARQLLGALARRVEHVLEPARDHLLEGVDLLLVVEQLVELEEGRGRPNGAGWCRGSAG
jgi:hypothetical protein